MMGNNITYEVDDDDIEVDEVTLTLESGVLREALDSMVGQIINTINRPTTEMPLIRKKPDLQIFRHTSLYREIKALCAMPANSKRPNDRWSLSKALMRRESGFFPYKTGAFSPNMERRITNLFIPNKKDERIMSLEAKVFICKHNKDGSKLITASQDGYIRIYDSAKGTYHLIQRMKAQDVSWSILDIDFSPCGQYFAYSSWADYFFVVPVNGPIEQLQCIPIHGSESRTGIFSLRFSPCNRDMIGGCSDGCFYRCDRETRDVKRFRTQRSFHQPDINAISYTSDTNSNTFVTGCNNGVLKLWDNRTVNQSRPNPSAVFVGHLDGITYIDPRNDDNYLLTNSKDQSIKIWDLRKPTESSKILKAANQLPMLDWDYRWDTVPREYYNPNTPLDGDASIMTYRGHRVTKSLLRAKFSPAAQTGQRYIYTGCGTGRIIIYDVLTGSIKEAIESHKDIVRDLSWHPVRSEIISSSWDSHVNFNSYKRNLLLKRPSSERIQGPLRRSRRIAHLNGELDDDETDEMYPPWQSW